MFDVRSQKCPRNKEQGMEEIISTKRNDVNVVETAGGIQRQGHQQKNCDYITPK
jgi:CxxC motif-containing protein